MESWTETDRQMMTRALELAARGMGQVSPGPLVGTVIVDADGEIAGEGFYLYEQVQHAETAALAQAGERARGGTAYVSLEPHAHQGRTPPCTNALIKAGIRRVVAPVDDPNPKVSGRGFAHLRAANVEVCTGLRAAEATRLNEAYMHFMRTGRPFVHLKLAVSLDGKVATRTGDSRWITGEESRARAHELRHQCDAIMVGGGTVRADDPLLTDRSGQERRRPLIRVVLDQCLQIASESRLAQTADDTPVLVFSGSDAEASVITALRSHGVEVINEKRELMSVLDELGTRSIQSVLVEGGPTLAGLLLDEDLVNKITFFIAPVIIGGQDAPSAVGGQGSQKIADSLELENVSAERRGRDIELTGYPARTADR
jgi:diaminohydroxyphosphoribosylaminopyrimidine deaminase/5-amino-6-(5-phosphoribosylamino)uracil reductase